MMSATYSPEDNKLRLYSLSRLDAETYAKIKAAGFKWAPKQDLFVAPGWTPRREDALLDLCGEIGDEDYSTLERSADRAERFSGYRDNRAAEAGVSADRFEAGPDAFGHQNRERAQRQAAKLDRSRTFAVNQWNKAEYWQQRTQGVISHALHRADPAVRRSRILRLEAEQRKHEKEREDYAKRWQLWNKVTTLDGADAPGNHADDNAREFTPESVTPALKLAYNLANYGHCGFHYKHPRRPEAGETSLYSLITDPQDPITPREAAALWLDGMIDPADPESDSARWSAHYVNRLAYERAMLANEGGSAADAEMEPGGWIGSHQIQAVNKSPATGRVVSVKILAPKRWAREENPPLTLQSFNVERLPEGAYRAPTDAEREAFKEEKAQRKAEEKASKPKAPSLINPTPEDAQRLQDLLNQRAKARHDKARAEHLVFSDYQPIEVISLTQERYSALSKGAYSSCETRTLHACGKIGRRSTNLYTSEGAAYDKALGECVGKIRIRCGGFAADHVIVITDKPQKPLPLDWDAITRGEVSPASAHTVEV